MFALKQCNHSPPVRAPARVLTLPSYHVRRMSINSSFSRPLASMASQPISVNVHDPCIMQDLNLQSAPSVPNFEPQSSGLPPRLPLRKVYTQEIDPSLPVTFHLVRRLDTLHSTHFPSVRAPHSRQLSHGLCVCPRCSGTSPSSSRSVRSLPQQTMDVRQFLRALPACRSNSGGVNGCRALPVKKKSSSLSNEWLLIIFWNLCLYDGYEELIS